MQLRNRYALTILLVIVITVTAVASATLFRVRVLLDETQHRGTAEMNAALEEQLHQFGIAKAEQLASVLAEPLYHFELDRVLNILRPVLDQEAVVKVQVFDPTGLVIHDGTDAIEVIDVNTNVAGSETTGDETQISGTSGTLHARLLIPTAPFWDDLEPQVGISAALYTAVNADGGDSK